MRKKRGLKISIIVVLGLFIVFMLLSAIVSFLPTPTIQEQEQTNEITDNTGNYNTGLYESTGIIVTGFEA